MLRTGFAAATVLLVVAQAGAQEERRISGFDLGLEASSLQGQRVRVTDCLIVKAGFTTALCPILSARTISGVISFRYAASDQASRRRAIQECGDEEGRKECLAEVSGRVRATAVPDVVPLEDAVIHWK